MNRYILIRRLRGPAVLLLIGIIALLHQADLASWKLFIPLLLILLGVLKLAERMTLAAELNEAPDPYPGMPYPGGPYAPGTYPAGVTPPAGTAAPGSSIVPSHSDDYNRGSNGG